MIAFAINIPDPIGIGDGILGMVAKAASTIFDEMANKIGDAVEAATAGVGTSWVRINAPSLATVDGHASPVVQALQADLKPWVAAFLMLAIIVGAARAAIDGKPERLGNVVRGIVTAVVVIGASAAAIELVVSASDAFSQTVIDHALQGNSFGKHVAAMLAPAGPGAVIGTIVLGLIAFLAALVQIALLALRSGVLVVLTAVLPVAYALYGTETGREWARRLTAWVLAFALYKPAAALIYAASFRLIDQSTISADGIVKATVGTTLMIVAILALPALLKLLVPAVQHVHLRAGGSGSAAVTAAAMAPTGAVPLAAGARTMREMVPTGAINAPTPVNPRPAPPTT